MFRSSRFIEFALLTILGFALAGCGSSSSGGGDVAEESSETEVSTFAGSGSGYADGNGAAAQFFAPFDLATDGTNLFVGDTFNHRIRRINIASRDVTTVAGDGTAAWFDSLIGANAQFNQPAGITTDGVNLYVADRDNDRIRQVAIATGVVSTLAGNGIPGWLDNLNGLAAQFDEPYGITTDGGFLYVADRNNHRIRRIVIVNGIVTTLAGDGTAAWLDDPVGTSAQFDSPRGVTTDGINLYVADTGNRRIRQIVIATGAVTTLAGDGGTGYVDGIGAAARFVSPSGITTDGTNLYVTDGEGTRIRQIVIATREVSTLSGTAGRGYQDGTRAEALFNEAEGLVKIGNSLYIADISNHRIRKLNLP